MTDVVVVNDSNNTVVINPPDTNNVSVTEKNTTVNITAPTQNQVQVQEQVPNVVQISAYGVPVGLYATTQELTDAINPVATAIGTHIQEFIDWIESDNLIESINGTTVDAPRQLVQRYLPNFTFTWPFVFADDALGTGLSSNPDGKTYVGMASGKSSPTPTNNPADYTWVPIAVVDVPDIEVPTFIDTCSVEVADNSSYVLSNQYVSITVFDNDSDKIPTFTFDTEANTFTVNNGLGRVVTFLTGGEESSLLQLISYFDGNTGNYVSHVFKVALSLPATPTTGSFNGAVETHPSGWVPQPVYKTGIDTWITEGIYEETSPSVWTLISWTVPQKITNVFGTLATAPNQIGYVSFPSITSVGYLYWATVYERNEYRIINSAGTVVKSGLVFSARVDIDTLPVDTYSFEVRVNTGTDYSKWVVHSFAVSEPTSVTALTTEVGNDFITVTRPVGYPNGVIFSVGLTDVSATTLPTELTDMERSLRFDNLSPETSYKIWIAPVSVLGVGTYTDFTETTTNNASSLLYLLSPTFDGIVSDFATVNQLLTNARDDIESLEDVLTSTNEIVEEVQESIGHFSERLDGFSASSDTALRQELFDRTETDLTLLTSISRALAAQEEYRRRLLTNENLTDVLISIDYENGTYVNKAFRFTEDKFTQAQLSIDGANANINLLTESLAWTDNSIVDLQAEIDLIPGVITQTVSSAVSEGLSAVQPAHSFNFFDSAQGWYAINGTITESLNQILTTWCDIQNDSLDYLAEENPVIRIDIERTAGTGWDGTVEFTINGSIVTYSNFIEEPATASQTLLLDLNAFIDSTYVGAVTGMRVILGTTVADEFTVKSIIIGKNDAAIQELQSITARVTDAELSLDAIEGKLSGFVTSTYYDNNTITFSNVELTLDALESYAAIKSTYQEINEDDIVTKANTAATFINGYTGTIQDILQGYDVDLEDVNTTLTDISTTLSVQDGRITNQIAEFSAQTHMSYEDSLALLNSRIQSEFGTIERINREFTYAEAINDLKIATSDRGALAQSIQELTAITSTATDTLYAYNQRISAAETDIEGNQLAIEGLNLLVDSASTGLTAALERIDAVEILSGDNAEALSSVTALVENETTGLSAAYTLAQNAKVSADNSATSLLLIQGDVDDPTTGLSATYTIASETKITADNTAESVTTITNTINDPETGLSAVAAIASGVRSDYNTFIEAYNVFQGAVEDPVTGLSATYTVASNAQTKSTNNATAINLLQVTVNDPETGVSANAALLSTVNQTVGEHTTSINTLTSTIDDEDTGLAATVTTLATLDGSLDDYRTSVQLTVDANGNLGFIQLDGTPSGTTLKLQAGEVEFLDSASNPAIFFDLNENEYSFAGRITLSSKIGTETFEDLQDRSALSKTQLDDISNDDKLTPSEKQTTKLEFDKINAEYPIIIAEASNYGVSSADYTNKHTGINNYLDGLVADLTTTTAINGETFRGNFAQYYTARETLLRAISSKAKTNFDNLTGSLGSLAYDSLVEAAKLGTTIMEGGYIKTSLLDVDVLLAATAVFDGSGNYTGNVTGNIAGTAATTVRDNANTALSNANAAQDDADVANELLSDIASDNKLTPSEKQSTQLEMDKINDEYSRIITQANDFGVSVADYTNKYNGINNYTSGLLSDLTTTSTIVGTTFRNNFALYYDARQVVLNAISDAAKASGDDAQSNLDTLIGNLGSVAYQDLIEASKLGTTVIVGGYIKTNLINADVVLANTAVFDGSGNYTGDVTGNVAGTAASTVRDNASNALSAANAAQTDATTALNTLTDIANDSKITPSEKQVLKPQWEGIKLEYTANISEANNFGVSTTNYTNKYNSLYDYIDSRLSNITTTSDVDPSTIQTQYAQYYEERQKLLNAISAKAKQLADSAQSSANTVSGGLTTLENSLGSVAYQNLISRAYLDRDITTALGNLTPNGSTPNGTVNDLVSYSPNVVIAAKNSGSSLSILQNAPTEYTIRFPNDGQYRNARYAENLVCTGGEKYAVKFHFAVESGNTQTVQMRIDFEDIDGTITQVVDYATQSNNTWTQYDYILSAPADAVKINAIYLIRITNNYTGGYSYVTGLEVKRVVTGQDILDGAIESAKLGTTIIDGGYIKTDLLDVGTLFGVNATFSGEISSVFGSFGAVTTTAGGYLRTAAPSVPGIRTVINGPNTTSDYAIWVGEGNQTENNAKFFIRKDGVGYISEEFFAGFLPESNSATSNTLSVTVTHESVGNPVTINYNSRLLMSSFDTAMTSGWDAEIEIRRGSTVLATIDIPLRVFVDSEPGGPQGTDVNGEISGFILDDSASVGTQTYGVYMTLTKPIMVDYEFKENAITTNENRITS